MSVNVRVIVGGAVWSAWVAVGSPNFQHGAWALALLLFAALVLVPLAVELAGEEGEYGWSVRCMGWVRILQLPAAFSLMVSCALEPSVLAALAALPWVAFTGVVAATGGLRVIGGGGRRPFHRLCGDAAFVFLGVGGAWVLADRGGARPLVFLRRSSP